MKKLFYEKQIYFALVGGILIIAGLFTCNEVLGVGIVLFLLSRVK